MAETQKKQHVEFNRKIRLRKELMEKAGKLTGAFYIPFIGEGDIAVALYSNNSIYGADIDPAMVETARSRLPNANIITADCDQFPFYIEDIEKKATYSLADFDSYSYPYDSFRSFFKGAKLSPQCVLIFTDGQRQAIIRTGHYRTPDGEKHHLKTVTEKREVYNFYYNRIILPWFNEYIKPYEVVYITKYLRSMNQLCWGAVIALPSIESHIEKENENGGIKPYKFDAIKKAKYLEHIGNGQTRGYAATLTGIHRQTVAAHMKADKEFARAVSEAESDAIGKMENALFEAGTSGNVTAQQVYLYNRNPRRWADRRNIRIAGEGGGPVEVEIDAKGKLISLLNRIAARAGEAEGSREPNPTGS